MQDLENRPMTRMSPRRSYRPGIAIAVAMAMLMAGCAFSSEDRPTEPASKVDAGTTALYGTDLTIARDGTRFYHGEVRSEVKVCVDGRRVLLFEQRPGRDRELGAAQSSWEEPGRAPWGVVVPPWKGLQRGDRIYAKAIRKEGSGYVCRPDRSHFLSYGEISPFVPSRLMVVHDRGEPDWSTLPSPAREIVSSRLGRLARGD